MYNQIEVSLRPNHRLALLAATPWLTLGATLLLSAAPLWTSLIIAPALLFGLWRDSRQLGLMKGALAVTALRISGSGDVTFLDGTGWQTGELRRHSRLFANWVLLSLRPRAGGRPRTIVLCDHSLCSNTSPESLRRLRAWLRLQPKPLGAAGRTIS